MPRLGACLHDAIHALERAGVDDARRTAEWILEWATGSSRARLYAFAETLLTSEQTAQIEAAVQRRAGGEPVQYVLGESAFYGLRLHVAPGVLIPRPETEELVTRVLELLADNAAPAVVDAGTGSGCIALALKHEHPGAHVHAFDVSEEALSVARTNARTLKLDVDFARADLLAPALDGIPQGVDVLVSNPPYIPDAEASTLARHVRDFEPHAALFSGPEPYRFYEALARHALTHVRPGGYLAVETHMDFADGVAHRFTARGLRGAEVHRDVSGHPRIVIARR